MNMNSKLIINLDEISSNTDVSISKLVSWGIKHCEIRVINGKNISYLTEKECLELKFRLENAGLQPYLITSPIFKWNFCNGSRISNLNKIDTFGVSPCLTYSEKKHVIENVINNAKILNTKKIRIFSGTNCTLKEFLQSNELKNLISMYSDYYFLIENEKSGALKTLSDFITCKNFIEQNNIKNLGFLLDIGNISLCDKEFNIQDISNIKNYVQHIQLKNFQIKNNAVKFTSLEEGIIEYHYILQEIKKIWLQRNINIGIETDIWNSTLRYRSIKESVRYLKNYLKEK